MGVFWPRPNDLYIAFQGIDILVIFGYSVEAVFELYFTCNQWYVLVDLLLGETVLTE